MFNVVPLVMMIMAGFVASFPQQFCQYWLPNF